MSYTNFKMTGELFSFTMIFKDADFTTIDKFVKTFHEIVLNNALEKSHTEKTSYNDKFECVLIDILDAASDVNSCKMDYKINATIDPVNTAFINYIIDVPGHDHQFHLQERIKCL